PSLDFAGGPYRPRWEVEPPAWLPLRFASVIGWHDSFDRPMPFGEDFPGMLMGGNAVVRRSVLERIGGYNVRLGRTGRRLLSGEDYEMFRRLLDAGARGVYFPDMAIIHFIPAWRLRKNYFRRWAW